MSLMGLTPAQLAEWVENGATTVRTPLDAGELRRCGEAMAAAAPQKGATRTGRAYSTQVVSSLSGAVIAPLTCRADQVPATTTIPRSCT